jgi:integrase/recombinase XerD
VRRLLAWYREGADVRSRLPELSVYLGHLKPEDTYWYLSAIPELLGIAAQRFERFADVGDLP